jgi:hypothetical protein
MNNFNFAPDTPMVTGDQNDYFSYISEKYFWICKDHSVLEIGPNSGLHSKFIGEADPKYFEVIEGNEAEYNTLVNIPGIDKITINDALLELQQQKLFDVCICLGVLYHLHSPLHLLELLVNNCQPKYIMLDNISLASTDIYLQPEKINMPGNAQTVKNWKSCQLSFVLPFPVYNESLYNMGYDLQLANYQSVSWFPKSNGWTALWVSRSIK